MFGTALGYEDLLDHDELRHDPVPGAVPGRLEARRRDCAPLAGKSTLNRLEHAPERLVLDLFADRTSATAMRANQLRL